MEDMSEVAGGGTLLWKYCYTTTSTTTVGGILLPGKSDIDNLKYGLVCWCFWEVFLFSSVRVFLRK